MEINSKTYIVRLTMPAEYLEFQHVNDQKYLNVGFAPGLVVIENMAASAKTNVRHDRVLRIKMRRKI